MYNIYSEERKVGFTPDFSVFYPKGGKEMLFKFGGIDRALEKTFHEMKIKYEYDAENNTYFAYYTLSEDLSGVLQCVVHTKDHLVYNTAYPQNVEPKYLGPVCMELLDINNRAMTGSFDVDREDGSVAFRSTVSLLGNTKPSKEVLREQIELGLASIVMFHRTVWMRHHPPRFADPMID